MRAYMDLTEYETLTGDSTTEDLLKRASMLVENALIGAIYTSNDQGIPTDADILEAVQWAIVYQVKSIEKRDARIAAESALVTQFGGKLTSAKIGSAQFTVSGENLPLDDLYAPAGRLCLRSLIVLSSAGLQPSAAAYG